MRIIFLLISFTLIFSPISSQAEEIEGNVCKLPADFLKEPITPESILLNLFVRFNRVDKFDKKLKFTAKPIKLEGGVITFENPRLNGTVINDTLSRCTQTKENIFGYKICKEHEVYSIAEDLCRQLGLEGAAEPAVSEKVRSSKEPFNYMYGEGKWERMRLYSALAPVIHYSRLKTISCKTGI